MVSFTRDFRTTFVAVRAVLVLTVLLGIGYPLVVTGIGQLAFPAQANGSVLTADGTAVGSALVGQQFTDAAGNALPQWFQSRPTATDGSGRTSGASNLAQDNPAQVALVAQRRTAIAEREHVPESAVPADAITASASGLDPDISSAYAQIQVNRVAEARGLDRDTVAKLVQAATEPRELGFLGTEHVNVLRLNTALAALSAPKE